MQENFIREIKYLLAQIPNDIWKDFSICGLRYEFMPWQNFSSIAIQTRRDDSYDPASWKYYDCASSNCSRHVEEVKEYKQSYNRIIYHDLLLQAAEALLLIDLSEYGQQKTVEDGYLYAPFKVQVYDPDESFSFNYCEYVLARCLELG